MFSLTTRLLMHKDIHRLFYDAIVHTTETDPFFFFFSIIFYFLFFFILHLHSPILVHYHNSRKTLCPESPKLFLPPTTPSRSAVAFPSFVYVLPEWRKQNTTKKRDKITRGRGASFSCALLCLRENYSNVCDLTLHTG